MTYSVFITITVMYFVYIIIIVTCFMHTIHILSRNFTGTLHALSCYLLHNSYTFMYKVVRGIHLHQNCRNWLRDGILTIYI